MPKKTDKVNDNSKSQQMPRHIAIIMDGNGRWAKKKLMPRTVGHRAGMSSLKEVVKACDEWGIPVLTVFAFSTENWKRPHDEVSFLMRLLVEFLHKELMELHENNVRINLLGDLEPLPVDCQGLISEAIILTRNNSGLIFNIALNYGSRLELVHAARRLAELAAQGKLAPEQIDEQAISDMLFTAGLPDPDLVIRTAGEMRISNFLLWQIAYAELWVTGCLWPDFNRGELIKAINAYQQRERRFGGLGQPGEDGADA